MDFTATRDKLITEITNISSDSFDAVALQLFRFQAEHNSVYKQFISLLSINPLDVKSVNEIPFLPISLFKRHKIKTGKWTEEEIFSSSGTTGQISSRHHVKSSSWYKNNSKKGFEQQYGQVCDYCILALLPAYLERKGSSLVSMAQHFIELSKYEESGFFLFDHEILASTLKRCIEKAIPTLLIGVSFGLLDFVEKYPMDLKNVIVMETGGMKGRRKEITRFELHEILKNGFQVSNIHSEYGMTELFSQAYSQSNGIFYPSPTMRILTREITDPLKNEKINRPGAINIIDLANIDSCAFIATDDLGRYFEDGSFEVLGRLDSSDIRGCNLMVSDQH